MTKIKKSMNFYFQAIKHIHKISYSRLLVKKKLHVIELYEIFFFMIFHPKWVEKREARLREH